MKYAFSGPKKAGTIRFKKLILCVKKKALMQQKLK